MKKILTILAVVAIILSLPLTVKAAGNGNIETVDASATTDTLEISGTTQDVLAAVVVQIRYNGNIVAMETYTVMNNSFSGKIENLALEVGETYEIRVADYDGGTWKKINVTVKEEQEDKEAGLGKGDDGNWYYYDNGVVDTTKTGIVGNDRGLWYVENGQINFNYSGVVADGDTEYVVKYGYMSTGFYGLVKKNDGTWAYAEAGVLTYSYTGLAKNDSGWWFIKDGVIDFTYIGIGSNATGDYRVVNGLIDFTYNGWFRDNTNAKWYYIKGGMVNKSVAGLVKKGEEYYYVENGEINFNFTGIVENAGTAYYVKYGYLDFSFDGVVTVGGQKYTVENGIVQ